MKKQIHSDKAPAAIGPYSQAIQCCDKIYVSGQLPINPETGEFSSDISEQTEQAMKNIQAILEEAGFKMEHIVKCQIFVTDLADFAKVNEVYGKFFAEPYPARCCFQVSALPKGASVEIDAVACR